MSTLSVVAITVLVSIFSILLLIAIAALIYVYILVRRQINTLILTVQESKTKFDTSYQHIETLIASVHGDKIEKAAQAFLDQIPRQAQIATRIEQSITGFSSALKYLTDDSRISGADLDRASSSGLLPNSYAPSEPGEHFVSHRSTPASDNGSAFGEEVDGNGESAEFTDQSQ